LPKRLCVFCERKAILLESQKAWITRYYCTRRKSWCEFKGRPAGCPYFPKKLPSWVKE